MHETINEYIQAKGWESKKQSGQIVVGECPFCHDTKSHFYCDPDKNVFFCHKCSEGGNLWTLKKYMGDVQENIRPAFKKPKYKKPDQQKAIKYHQALLKDSEALEFLKEDKGITRESVERFKLGLCHENGIGWLTTPHFKKGDLINIKFRSLPPAEKTFKRIAGCRSILFNVDALQEYKEKIHITEGESDAIALVQAGVENVVGGTTGAGSFDPEWIDQLKSQKKIFICYDSDQTGQKGARSLAKRLGYNRCFNIELPEGQDVNDFFKDHDIFDFQTLVRQARKLDLPGVISVSTAIGLLAREKQTVEGEEGLLTPWSNVNRIIKGFHAGDLVILTAFPKIGKTSWALEIAMDLALKDKPVLFFCLEMRPERLVKKLIQRQYRKENVSFFDIERAENEFAGLPLYFGHSFKKQKLEDVLDLIREAIKRYDLKFAIFDNLHFLIRSISNVNEELGQAVQGFKLLAEEMEIPIMAIAQPRKREGTARDEIMRAEDIKYSNAVHADCDQMIILHRKRIVSKAKEINQDDFTAKEEALDPVTLVRVEAHRYGAGGETLLYFHGEYSKFDLLEKDF